MRMRTTVATERDAHPGSSKRPQVARIPIRLIVLAALNVHVLLKAPPLATAAAAAASAVSRQSSTAAAPRAAQAVVTSQEKKAKKKWLLLSSSSSTTTAPPPPPPSSSLPPNKSDRERGWPHFYPRRFSPPPPPTSSKASDATKRGSESASTTTTTTTTTAATASPRSLPTPPKPPSQSASADESEKLSKRSPLLLLLPASSNSTTSSSTANATANLSAAPSSPTVRTITFFRRSRMLFTRHGHKNETSPAVAEEETTITTITPADPQPSKEEGGSAPTSGGAVDETVDTNSNASTVADPNRHDGNCSRTSALGVADESRNQSIASHNASDSSSTATPDTTSTSTQQQPQPPQPPAGGLILLGTPPSIPYRIYRRGAAGGLAGLPGTGWDPTAQPSPGRGGTPTTTTVPASSAAVVLAELATSVLGTVTRILLLRSLTGWLANQQEAMAPTQHFVWECLNDRFVRDESALATALSAPPAGVSGARWRRQVRARIRGVRRAELERAHRLRQKQRDLQLRRQQLGQAPSAMSSATSMDAEDLPLLLPFLDPASAYLRTVVVVELTGEGRDGPDNDHLADIVTFLLSRHRNHAFGTNATDLRPADLEVVLLVQSPGGSVASFGLAAAQVRRLTREPGIRTTVCVDKYAASGGYMIASQAHQLIAAPFASVGSVGVILEGLNFHELARKYGVQPLVIKAGESKNPITTFGSITKQDMDHQKDQLEKVHVAFKDLVVQGRPALADKLDRVANGNVFLGEEAHGLDLVDRVATSSQYLMERVEMGDRVLKLHRSSPSRFPRRVGALSPLDILPHLHSRFAHVRSEIGRILNQRTLPSWIVQGVTCMSLCHHLYAQYFTVRSR